MAESKLVKIKLNRGVTGIDFDGNPFAFGAGAEVEVEARLAKDLCQGDNPNAVLMTADRENTTAKAAKEKRNG